MPRFVLELDLLLDSIAQSSCSFFLAFFGRYLVGLISSGPGPGRFGPGSSQSAGRPASGPASGPAGWLASRLASQPVSLLMFFEPGIQKLEHQNLNQKVTKFRPIF